MYSQFMMDGQKNIKFQFLNDLFIMMGAL